MEDLLALARRPPIITRPSATARQLAALMTEHNVGAAVVLDDSGALVGVVSERDIVSRVVARKLDPDATLVEAIMTKKVHTAHATDTTASALEMMVQGHFRHLPIVDEAGAVVGMLSVRHLLKDQIGELSRRNVELVNFISTDGSGG